MRLRRGLGWEGQRSYYDNSQPQHQRIGRGVKARYLNHIVSKEGAEFLCL